MSFPIYRVSLALLTTVSLYGCGDDAASTEGANTPPTNNVSDSKSSSGVSNLNTPSDGSALDTSDQQYPSASDGEGSGSDGDPVAVD